MPYITEERRFEIESGLLGTADVLPGDLNYMITRLVDRCLAVNGKNYTSINAAIGVLECAKLELYRRIAAPYEDEKIEENGDVYET